MNIEYLVSQIAMLLFLLIVLASLGFYIRVITFLVSWLKSRWNPELVSGVISFAGLVMILITILPIFDLATKFIIFVNSMILMAANYKKNDNIEQKAV